MADGTAPARKRAKACKDVDSVAQVLAKHLSLPDQLHYGTNVSKGCAQPELMGKHRELLRQLRAISPSVTKLTAEAAFLQLAKDKEGTWHLAGDQQDFASGAGAMIRAMLRDIGQHLLKAKDRATVPEWLAFSSKFHAAAGSATPA